MIFTNQIGDKQIFYYHDNNRFIFGSEMNYLLSFFNKSNIDYSLDISAVYMLITYGFMLEDYTLLNEVKKLNAGEYIKLSRNRLEVRDYFRLNNTQEIDSSEDEIIESIDSLFRNAVKLQFEKDREYGYKHLTSLSGGLDSRMTTWVAHQMGYRQVNYTFSQSNYLDEIIAKKIARDLKNEWIFKFLDNGTFLFDFCKIANLNFGLANFVGTSHGKSMIDLLNLSEFGIIHTGALGDVVLGTYFSDKNRRNFKHGDGGNSNKFLEKLSHKDLKKKYDNEEIFKFYNRGFNGILLSNLAFQLKTESISPFLDVDLINYCMRLPLEFRLDHNIYFKWIKKKYPGATKYIWERTNTKITARRIRIFGRVIPVKLLPKKLFLFALRLIYNKPLISKKNMNPFEYWVKDNKDLSNWIDNSFKSKINCIDYLPELKKDLSELFSKGNVIEKLSVISFLCTHEYYFSS